MKTTDIESSTILLDGLRSGPTVITFTKKDGSVRSLLGTLNPALIPNEYAPKGVAVTEDVEEPTYVRVYDIENEGWRTVTFDAVLDFAPAVQ